MKLQVAFDYFDLDDALKVLDQIHSYIDIAEIGTPLVLRAGTYGVETIREKYPELCILADLKIMDGGFGEADMFFKAGANIVTVMGVANLSTIQGVTEAAHKNGGCSFVDMMVVPDLRERALEVEAIGADYIGVHTAFDVQDVQGSPCDDLQIIQSVLTVSKAAIAGGIKLERVREVKSIGAEIMIVGGSIVNAEDKIGTIEAFRKAMQ